MCVYSFVFVGAHPEGEVLRVPPVHGRYAAGGDPIRIQARRPGQEGHGRWQTGL